MPVFRHEIVIQRPIEAVFAAVADVHTHPKWQKGLLRSDAARGNLARGESGAEVRRMFGRNVRFPYEITNCDPPYLWGFRATGGPIRPSAVLRFTSVGGGTQIASQLTIPGKLGWLLGPVMLRQQKRNYRNLKKLLEAGTI